MSRQSSSCAEAELTTPSTVLSSPTSLTTSSPPPRAEHSASPWTEEHEDHAVKNIKVEAEGGAGCLLLPLPWRGNGENESKKTQIECCSCCWMLVNLIAFATMHYCEASRERASLAGGRCNRLMAKNWKGGKGPYSHTDSTKTSSSQDHHDSMLKTTVNMPQTYNTQSCVCFTTSHFTFAQIH